MLCKTLLANATDRMLHCAKITKLGLFSLNSMTSIFDIIKKAKEKNNLENLPILQVLSLFMITSMYLKMHRNLIQNLLLTK